MVKIQNSIKSCQKIENKKELQSTEQCVVPKNFDLLSNT